MKRGALGIIQFAISFLVLYLLETFFFKVLGVLGMHPKGTLKMVAIFIKYLLECIIVGAIYYRNIKSGKNKMNKGTFANIIYCVACFLVLIIITILLHQVLNHIGYSKGISIDYDFKNYFNDKFSLDLVLSVIIECAFIPFLLCCMFPLGFSNIFKSTGLAIITSGLCYGIFKAIPMNTSFEIALFNVLTPMCIVMMLTYLYKINSNIAYTITTYAIYVLFGVFAINYIL